MQDLPNSAEVSRTEDVKNIFLKALDFREAAKDQSCQIALDVFDRTSEQQLTFELPVEYSRVRDEFGALEAPGSPPNDSQPQLEFEDFLWRRLRTMVLDLS